MSILALDHGTVRIGVAVSDELGMLAHPLDFLPAEPVPEFLNGLKKLIQEREVSVLLVGLPRNMDGSYGPAVRKVEEFVLLLKETIPIPIRTWDERLTTTQAHRMLAQSGKRSKDRRGRVDSSAAAVLLQSYLDAQSALGGGIGGPDFP
jgi:putative Holliday junction resolvase